MGGARIRIGLLLAALLALGACQSPTAGGAVGTWGGSQASLQLTPQGGQVTYLCGTGTIDPGWALGGGGSFTGTGKHYFGGGPLPSTGRAPHPATYAGRIDGDHLTLTVTVTDSGTTLGPFDLVRNGPQVKEACV